MQRRKFIAAIGSVAAGAAATVGTGAFTTVQADRSVAVQVAGDANAFLGLDRVTGSANSQAYVTGSPSSGEISFDFSSSNGTSDLGDGFNPDAVTRIDDLLLVTNRGTQNVNFWVDISSLNTGSASVTISTDSTNAAETGGSAGSDQLAYNGSNAGNVDVYTLAPGDSIVLDLEVDTTGQGPASLSGTVTFVAENGGSP
jgi:hypothetical protein